MKSRKDEVLDALRANPNELTAQELADQLGVDRTNVSRYLNELTKDGTVKKIDGRPVKFQITTVSTEKHINFDNLIGREDSLKSQIQKSKAAILYPPADCIRSYLVRREQGKRCLRNACIALLFLPMY